MSLRSIAARSFRVRVLASVLFSAIFLYSASGVASAAPQDITITPTSVSPVINPGATLKGSFQVINQGRTSYRFIVYATPYRVDSEAYTPDFTVLPTAPNISSWLNFSSPGGSIKPGQTINIGYTITIPDNTQPGGYYAAAFAETQYPKVANSITLNERVGELFYIQVAGPVVKKGEVLTWQSNLFQKPPLTSEIRLQNDGSIHYQSTIQLNVKDLLGHTKYQLNTQKEVLPQTIRRVSVPWNKTPSIGLFKVSGTVSFLGQTHKLSTKWVLVMSNTVRWIIVGLILILLAFVGLQQVYRRKHSKRFKRQKK